ncbi:MAG TPA: hypothetical protein PL195_11190 [bacterium]|nr:hypothetical protein [bacterium]
MSTESIKILQNCLKKLKEMPQEEFNKMVIEKGLGEEFEEDDSVYEDDDFTLVLPEKDDVFTLEESWGGCFSFNSGCLPYFFSGKNDLKQLDLNKQNNYGLAA